MTQLTKKQQTTFKREHPDGASYIIATLRHDDRCGNGHNTLSITGSWYTKGQPRIDRWLIACGCLHDEIRKTFPELAHLIDWHLCSTDGPLHYIANTVYFAKNGDLEAARRSAIWPDATLEQLLDVRALQDRLPALLETFQQVIEAQELVY